MIVCCANDFSKSPSFSKSSLKVNLSHANLKIHFNSPELQKHLLIYDNYLDDNDEVGDDDDNDVVGGKVWVNNDLLQTRL